MSNRHFILNRSFLHTIKLLLLVFVIIFTTFNNNSNLQVIGQEIESNSFDSSEIISEKDLYGLPAIYSSPALIQSYLESKNSVLAKIEVEVSFEPGSLIIDPDYNKDKPHYLRPILNISKYQGQMLRPSEIIWLLARGDLGNGCSTAYHDVCYNNREIPINPGFILAKIQKEQGLVYGSMASRSPDDPTVKFRIERALGYYCTSSNKSTSCYDENPNWRYYKGFFRQLYFGIRIFRIREQTCKLGEPYAFSNFRGVHKVGATLSFRNGTADNSTSAVYLKNGITCSLYIYTPYISAQNLLYNVLKAFDLGRNHVSKSAYPAETIIYYQQVESQQPVQASFEVIDSEDVVKQTYIEEDYTTKIEENYIQAINTSQINTKDTNEIESQQKQTQSEQKENEKPNQTLIKFYYKVKNSIIG